MTTNPIVHSELLAELALRQLPCGGWAALASSSQPAIEPTCYSALALGSAPVGGIERAQQFLLRTQNPNGSWPVFPGDDQEGGWITSLAVMALRDLAWAIPASLQGIHWVLNCAGKESNWFWKWKFRTADRHVRFNPDKYGWPWFPNTVSWVVPTAFAVLALGQIPCSCDGLEHVAARIDCGVQMLFDRACPGGGWNAGNGVVYGTVVAPHPDDTAIALLEHFSCYCIAYPQWANQAEALLAVTWARAWEMAASKLSTVRALAERSCCLIFDQACSMGLKSGE